MDEKKQSEIESTDELSGDSSETANETEGENETETDAPETDNESPDADTSEPEAVELDDDKRIADEQELKEPDAEIFHEKSETLLSAGSDSEPVEEERQVRTPKKLSWPKIAVSAVLILAVFSGFFFFENKSKTKTIKKEKSNASETKAVSLKKQKRNILETRPAVSNSMYDAKINEISALRDTLLRKQEEVSRLKKHYQEGIEELEKEIADELQKVEISTFLQALENKRIAFTLRTIQRRQAYIQQLEQPYNWIFKACEELLYIKRRAMMDLQVAEVAGGIEMNKHVRRMNAAVQEYQPTADKLALDMTTAQPETLETIWERIQNERLLNASIRAQSKNQIISEQICTGNFNRLTELSEISAETAKCIIEMQGSDLFLHGLSEISPGVARQLGQWKGSWICLNGIRALSPRAAYYLFKWDGKWISLNGLTEFPVDIGEALLNWDGDQLELMGLQSTDDSHERIWIDYLAQWERSGGKLFVPGNLREKIDKLNMEKNRT